MTDAAESKAALRTLSGQTDAAIAEVLAGKRGGWRSAMLFAGPAVTVSIAYIDPGNYATNIQAGAGFGYALLWVVLMASLIAMLFQALSAKLGIVTGRNLAELCRTEFPAPVVYGMWGISEVAAMATDLAEFLGGAIGLSLLFGMPLLGGMLVTALLTYGILLFDRRGFRPIELIIGGLVLIVGLCFVAEVVIAPVSWRQALLHSVVPSMPNGTALTISVGIVGATIMPHAVYLHSALAQSRVAVSDAAKRHMLLRFSNRECAVALSVAGAVNMAMVMMAAAAFHAGHSDVSEIQTAYRTLTPLLGGGAAAIFLISLMASGISSSAVGTMAGQVIMQGFVRFAIPVAVRRLVTMIPAFVVAGLGVDATRALVVSQVVLSFALPLPMVALVLFTRRRDLMGEFVNNRLTDVAAIAGTVVIVLLNAILLLHIFNVDIPGLAA